MHKKRLTFLGMLYLIFSLVLVAAQGRICILKGDEYTKSAVMQRVDSIVVKERRGKFYDRNMIPLVENTVSEVKLPKKEYSDCKNGLMLPVRYGKNPFACHLIGHVDGEGKGVSGLEKCFDSFLAAPAADRVNVIKSAGGKIIENAGMRYTGSPIEGNSVVLTLDSHIQSICQKVLENYKVKGAVVVMDVKSFDILAMASYPMYNQGDISSYMKGGGSEFVNRCTSSYNAGSIFKLVTLCSAMENGALDYVYMCSGSSEIEGHIFSCHKYDGHGTINSADALSESCNCAFYTMGMKLGADKIIETARKFGFGEGLVYCSDFNESSGNIPVKEAYAPLDCINYAIGQGEILLTPVQAANMVAIIANDGVAAKVNVAQRVIGHDNTCKQIVREVGMRRVIQPFTAEFVREAMRLAVTEGTANSLKYSPANIAGKTGTAETGWEENGKNMVHGWFCGFFPYDNPQYAMAVIAENGGSGSLSAAPVFKEIAEEIIKIYSIG